jgi:predicted RecA/RadA family phage recombinase
MQSFKQPGEMLTLTAPSGGVVSGTAYKIGQLVVVAAASVAVGLPFEGKTTGVFELPKSEVQAFAEGDLLYWTTTGDELTTTASGNMLCGVAAAAAGSAATTGLVRLDGVARPDEA